MMVWTNRTGVKASLTVKPLYLATAIKFLMLNTILTQV